MAETLAGTPVLAAPQVPRSVRLAAHAAALTLVPSGLWRIAIALGWDSGFTDEVLRPENFPGDGSPYLIGLSLFAETLGLLTLGLVHRWGEELPRWVPFLGGRRIPVSAAVIPASLGAALVTLITFTGAFGWNDADNMGAVGSPDGGRYWLMTACYLPLLAWGPLLAVVTVAYYRRRRRAAESGRRQAQAFTAHCSPCTVMLVSGAGANGQGSKRYPMPGSVIRYRGWEGFASSLRRSFAM